MEKDNFLEKLKKLVEVAKTKHNALDVAEINDFFRGDNLTPDQMEQIYSYLEERRVDVIPLIDDSRSALYAGRKFSSSTTSPALSVFWPRFSSVYTVH